MYVVVEIQDGEVTMHSKGYDTLQDVVNAFYNDAAEERNHETGDLELADIMESQAFDVEVGVIGKDDWGTIEIETGPGKIVKIHKM